MIFKIEIETVIFFKNRIRIAIWRNQTHNFLHRPTTMTHGFELTENKPIRGHAKVFM